MKRIAAEWKTTTLGQHTDIQTGFPFKSERYTDDPTATRLLRGDNIVQGRLRWDGVKRWPSTERSQYAKYELHADDVVLAMDRPWIEAGLKYAWISQDDLPCLLVQRVARLRGTNGLLTPFVRYIIGHHSFTEYLKGIWTGIAVPHISESQIRAFKVLLPPIATQKRIIEVMGAYDDLIENNIRRIKILEDMAQMLYREWFVNFRFHGHEKVKMVESRLGRMPEGWAVSDVGALSINHDARRIPLSSAQRATHQRLFPYYGASGVIDRVESPIFEGLHLLISEDGENLRSRKTPVAFLARGRFWVNNHAHIVQGRHPVSTEYLYASLKDVDISPYLTGTAQPKLSQANLNRIPVVRPDSSTLKNFDAAHTPLLGLVDTLDRMNSNLRITRDLLLPKLISGEIPVEAADETAAELMEATA